jgi:hypothetical protein
MKKIERNAILAGLRCLQAGFSTGRLTHDMFDILNDGIDKPITLGAIDTLCEQINFSEVDFERPDYGEFEVERVHLPINEPTAEVCKEGTCGNRHYFAVYKRDPKNGLADWQSDHATEQLARTAAAAYRSGAITRAHDENIAGLAAQVGYEGTYILG